MLVDLEKIIRAEKEITRAEANQIRVENEVQKLRDYKAKLVMATFSELETQMRRYRREIYNLKEENKALKSEI